MLECAHLDARQFSLILEHVLHPGSVVSSLSVVIKDLEPGMLDSLSELFVRMPRLACLEYLSLSVLNGDEKIKQQLRQPNERQVMSLLLDQVNQCPLLHSLVVNVQNVSQIHFPEQADP